MLETPPFRWRAGAATPQTPPFRWRAGAATPHHCQGRVQESRQALVDGRDVARRVWSPRTGPKRRQGGEKRRQGGEHGPRVPARARNPAVSMARRSRAPAMAMARCSGHASLWRVTPGHDPEQGPRSKFRWRGQARRSRAALRRNPAGGSPPPAAGRARQAAWLHAEARRGGMSWLVAKTKKWIPSVSSSNPSLKVAVIKAAANPRHFSFWARTPSQAARSRTHGHGAAAAVSTSDEQPPARRPDLGLRPAGQVEGAGATATAVNPTLPRPASAMRPPQ